MVSRFLYAGRSNVPEYMIKGGMSYRLILDHLGSVRLVINVANGQVTQRLDYDEYGRVLFDSNPGFQPFGFDGGLYDPDTKLVRFRLRDYDAEIGRWTCKDPIGIDGGMNWYGFAGNDPVNMFDPEGLSFWSAVGAFGHGLVGGALSTAAVTGAALLTVAIAPAAAGIVSTALIAGAAVGAVSIGFDLIYDHSSDNIAYHAGALVGGFGVGRAAGVKLAQKLSPPENQPSLDGPFSIARDIGMRWKDPDAPSSNLKGILAYLKHPIRANRTGPDPLSALLSSGLTGAGISTLHSNFKR